MSAVMGNLSSWNKLSTFAALQPEHGEGICLFHSIKKYEKHLVPYVGGSLALSRRYMSSAELSSLVQSPRHVNQRHVCYTPLSPYVSVLVRTPSLARLAS